MNKDCPFCNESKENRILKERKFTYVIFSNPRLMPCHLLVIPKRHVIKISQLTREEQYEIFDLLIEFQEKILQKVSSGCDIRQNFKPYVKNSRTHVDHVHFHLLPRKLEDELQQQSEQHKNPLYKNLSVEETEKFTSLLN